MNSEMHYRNVWLRKYWFLSRNRVTMYVTTYATHIHIASVYIQINGQVEPA